MSKDIGMESRSDDLPDIDVRSFRISFVLNCILSLCMNIIRMLKKKLTESKLRTQFKSVHMTSYSQVTVSTSDRFVAWNLS